MKDIVDETHEPLQLQLPSWIHDGSKVRYTIGRTTHHGRLHLGYILETKEDFVWVSTIAHALVQ